MPCSPGLGHWARHTWQCKADQLDKQKVPRGTSSDFSSPHRSNYGDWSESRVYFSGSLPVLVNIPSFVTQNVHFILILLDQILVRWSFVGQNPSFSCHFSGGTKKKNTPWDILPALGSPCQQNQCHHLVGLPLGHYYIHIYIYIIYICTIYLYSYTDW